MMKQHTELSTTRVPFVNRKLAIKYQDVAQKKTALS